MERFTPATATGIESHLGEMDDIVTLIGERGDPKG